MLSIAELQGGEARPIELFISNFLFSVHSKKRILRGFELKREIKLVLYMYFFYCTYSQVYFSNVDASSTTDHVFTIKLPKVGLNPRILL